jgi:hypothetical protein
MSPHYAWRTLREPLAVEIAEAFVDGRPIDRSLIDEEHLRVHLEAFDDWQDLDIVVEAKPGGEMPDELVDSSVYVLVECVATQSRIPFVLSGDPWTGRINLTRGEVEERFSLRAEIAAPIHGRWRIIGSSPEWTVVMDRSAAPVPPGTPPFETVWIDFGTPEAPAIARRMPEAYAVMDLEGKPRLMLNTGIDGFQHLLHADAAKLERRRLRDILGADVARYAVMTLFRAASAEILLDDDGLITPPERPLYRQVCEAVAERTPGIGSVEELYEQLVRARDSAAEAIEVWGAVDLAIAALTGVTSAISTACAEVKHG